ncbi:hypothetical protein [uncultured Cohaesibacter sp.]|uniref:capsid assembly protein n=1 Tax=uncultured Cohaesibacter sp. TaxID=1002546 RepID=UPI0029C9249F|nr:hypothetical protein [uncultured Cohaesibacter sp.]
MSEFETSEIFAGDEGAKGPSIEEQYASLVEEGYIEDDDVANAQGGAEGDPEGDNAVPDWVPEKFRDAEDPMKAMAEAYAALERRQSGEEDDLEDENLEDEAAGEEGEADSGVTEEDRKVAAEATEKAGLDLAEVQTEWNDSGELSDETYDALEAAGYPREAVDVYIEGLVSRTTRAQTTAYGIVGGEDAYEEMLGWAVEALSDEEAAVYDEAVNSKDPAKIKSAVRGLNARWMAAVMEEASEEPEDEITPRGGATTTDTYASFDDYMEDLNDPRYDTSETFRNKVMLKRDRSNL